ncbi:amino acid adenylation domain-containing protein (plasmid) [Streptomyces sp. NBC_01005]|uniref:amino acid adenylation domain-containing protein n=1 Tax=unclassified Streptomyces TaxID=2593676 RepID=UPI002F91B173|nr:amino acid adenylation domain-containing protein [Streptomyces sp. NBC_01005]WTD00652.1 amino acid adenylation domain-containing protein [Streptomyces sp. NBC_01650]
MFTSDEDSASFLIHRRFEARVRENPEAPALIHRGRTIGYGELDAAANRLAAVLRATGVGPEAVVGVHLERTPEAVTAVLAAWKAGGAYVPLDPAQPRQRLAHIVEDCDPAVIVTSARLSAGLPEHHARVVLVDGPAAAAADPAPMASAVRPDNLAYTIYTSGSTGRPKGVEVAHRGLVTSYLGWEEVYGLRDGVRSHLQVAGLSFDVSTGDFVRALLSGGTLVLCGKEDLLRPENLYRLITRHDVHMMDITPALLRLLMDHLEATGGRLDGMRLITVGGEGWPPRDYLRLRALVGPRTRVFCSYGVTESSVDSTCYETFPGPSPGTATLPIGHAFPGTRVAVYDRELGRTEDGAEGELYVTGAGLARGYRGKPALTALRFLPAPGGRRVYRTGDRARLLPDRAVEHLGRIDDEVKINGVRIQPAEVETALRAHPGVGQAVAVTAHEAGRVRLHAYVTPTGPATVTPAQVHEHATRTLPATMVPATVTVLDSLPLNTNGKVDRHRLPAPARGDEETYEEPKGSTEIRIAGIWQETLRLPRVGALDDFFMLGGDSLQSARVCARIRAEFHVDIQPSAVLTHPTVRELAAHATQLTPEREPPTPHPAPGGRYPLSPAQRRLWLLNLITGPDATYNIPIAFSAEGPLDRSALTTALNRIVARHAPLRTRIVMAGGEAMQEVLPGFELAITVTDLRGDPSAERRALDVLAGRVREPFDLTAGPLIRADLLRLDRHRHQVLVTVHHIVFDGWSAELFLTGLGQEYSAALSGATAGPPAFGLSYGDIAAWQDRRHRSGGLAPQLDHWKQRFRTPPPALDSLADRSGRDAGERGEAGRATRWLDPALTGAVRACGQQHATTLFVTLLSCFTVLLSRLAGEHDITVGTPMAGRDREEVQDLIGFFVNTVALRTDLTGTPTFAEVLGRVRDEVLAAHTNQDIPFEDVVAGVSAAGAVGRNPLFQTWFNLLGGPDQPPRMPGLDTEMIELPAHAALFDLGLYVTDHGDRLRLDLSYDRGLFGDARARVILEQLAHVIAAVTADPGVRTGGMSLVTDAHRALLPDTGAGPGDTTRTALAAGVRRGMATAAVHDASGREPAGGERLAALASRVTRELAALGVREGDVVALHAARTAALVPLLVGILERGAAFVLLDPAHPPARLRAQLAAVAPVLLIRFEEAGALPKAITESGVRVVEAGRLLGALDVLDAPTPAPSAPGAEHPAYIMFTSGSTGPLPRGVRSGPAPLAHFLAWYVPAFGLGPDSRFALLAGLGHDPLLRDVFTPLWAGGELHVPDTELIANPLSLLHWLAERRITVLHLTPPLARLLAIAAGETGMRLPDVRLICYGGDVLRQGDVAALAAVAPSARHVNFYGATETPQAMAFHIVEPGAADLGADATRSVPVGRGIADVQILVLNGSGQLAGVGEAGEIVIRTPYLAEGYVNASGANSPGSGGFHHDPMPGVRRYATGDRGRYLPDGTVEILGRTDAQVKIRGFRVDPAEIDAVCRRLPGVNDAVTVARQHAEGDIRLTTYVVTADGQALAPGQLRADLAARLPEYMTPSEVMEISSMPLTPNGKIDTRALPEPAPDREPGRQASGGDLEEIVRGIWQTVLEVEDIAPDDNFFDLGGTSRLMAQVQVSLRERLGRDITLVSLFTHASTGALARHLQQAAAPAPAASTAPRARRRDHAAARAQRLGRRGDRA